MSVKVTNTSQKTISVGTKIEPGETAVLPKGFGLEHPVVDFFIKRGWLTKEKVNIGGKKPNEADSKKKAADNASSESK